jgi:hypothetical protein
VLVMTAGELRNPVLFLVLAIAHDGAGRRVRESPIRIAGSDLGHVRQLGTPLRENVDHRLAAGDEIVGDDAAVSPPPHRLCAHHCTSPCMSCPA